MRFRDLGPRLVTYAAISTSILAVTACGGGAPAPQSSTPPPGAMRVDESKAGSVAGRVVFEGQPPANTPLTMESDPICAREAKGATLDAIVVSDGGLENVFVYVKDGLGNHYFDTPAEPAKLDQKGCRYSPRVVGVRVGQPLEISNSDPTQHNVHAVPSVNQDFNFTQPFQGMKNVKTFTAAEVMVPLRCDVHDWMHAYLGVVPHPYFAVTAGGGRFELKSVPAGTYTLEAWHEKLGTKTQSVTLGEKASKTVTFTFAQRAGTEP